MPPRSNELLKALGTEKGQLCVKATCSKHSMWLLNARLHIAFFRLKHQTYKYLTFNVWTTTFRRENVNDHKTWISQLTGGNMDGIGGKMDNWMELLSYCYPSKTEPANGVEGWAVHLVWIFVKLYLPWQYSKYLWSFDTTLPPLLACYSVNIQISLFGSNTQEAFLC